MPAKTADLPTIRGDEFRRTHQQSVTSILGVDTRPVESKGSRFYNVDRWTSRLLVKQMCDWAKANPGCCPTRNDILAWTVAANREPAPSPRIVIAGTPELLNRRTAMALVGGAYHEAFHTKYSCRRDLALEETAKIILPRWAKLPDWSKLAGVLLEWSNIIEDIRIERNGNREFPGVYVKMCDLQDFILNLETAGRDTAAVMGKSDENAKPLRIVSGAFRDIGLGYNTTLQRQAMAMYEKLNPTAYKMVVEGPLADKLREAISLSSRDDMGALRVAMDVIVEIYNLIEDAQKDQQNQPGKGGKTCCPKCNAPAKKLVVRPLSDGRGGKIPGKGVITCTVCGWQEVIPLTPPDPAEEQDEDSDPDNAIRYEDMPEQPKDKKPSKGKGDSKDKDSKDKDSKDKDSKDKDEKDSSKGKGSKSDDKDASEDEADGSGSGDESEDESGDESNGSGSDEGESGDDSEEGDDSGEGSADGDGEPSDPADPDQQGGKTGGESGDTGTDPKAWEYVAGQLLDDAKSGGKSGLEDVSTAMEQAFDAQAAKEDKDRKGQEAIWRPYDLSLDDVGFVSATPSADGAKADAILGQVRSEASFLRARLRNIVRAAEMTDEEHGLRKGRGLSERMLVDSAVAIRGRQFPDRAYYDEDDQIDTSLAAAIVVDESSSMYDKLRETTECLIAITEPLDALGCAVQVSGFRNGRGGYIAAPVTEKRHYHRTTGIRHDIFKTFDERFLSVKYRFGKTQATGGTPMSDGVQFGLDALNTRPEGHRVLFIITDGQPDGGHLPIIRRQIRLAKEAGIHIVGVGIGRDSMYVKQVFPDHVYADRIADMPKELVRKLNEILDARCAKRGQKIRKTA